MVWLSYYKFNLRLLEKVIRGERFA